MSKVSLNLKEKSDLDLLSFGTAHDGAMDGNGNFLMPEPAVLIYRAGLAAYEEALAQVAVKSTELQMAQATLVQAREEFEGMLRARQGYVESVSRGSESKILGAGFQTKSLSRRLGRLGIPLRLRCVMGRLTGEIRVLWAPVHGARSYVIQSRKRGTDEPWTQVKMSSGSRATITGLIPGQLYAFRVRALGSAGEGPWSDESVKMAPA